MGEIMIWPRKPKSPEFDNVPVEMCPHCDRPMEWIPPEKTVVAGSWYWMGFYSCVFGKIKMRVPVLFDENGKRLHTDIIPQDYAPIKDLVITIYHDEEDSEE